MSLYLDTSCLWKLLVPEPESARVQELVGNEPEVVVSSLTELEAEQVLLALRLGGKISPRQHRRLTQVLTSFRGMEPFQHRAVPHDLAQIARRQVAKSNVYCRTVDRLHLATMEALGLRRLLTHDDQQATAAGALGFGVLRAR